MEGVRVWRAGNQGALPVGHPGGGKGLIVGRANASVSHVRLHMCAGRQLVRALVNSGCGPIIVVDDRGRGHPPWAGTPVVRSRHSGALQCSTKSAMRSNVGKRSGRASKG
jgi:hypothetical protein